MEAIFAHEKKDEDDFYFILGCNETSTPEQITTEYRARVLDCHPDKHPEDPTAGGRCAVLQRAKDVLTDPTERKKYDQWRNSGIAISYSDWCAHRSAIHTSMHWATKKTKPMLNSCEENHHGAEKNPSDAPTHYTVKPKPVDRHSFLDGIRLVEGNSMWERDRASTALKKFRNYEI
ncbi:hypothetical protein ScPMuIL_005119 [Solemya velum]